MPFRSHIWLIAASVSSKLFNHLFTFFRPYVLYCCFQATFPAGVLNIVPGIGTEAGEAISNHPDIEKARHGQ